jgi:hypothetical protein
MQIGFAFRAAYPLQLQRSAAEAASLANACTTSYLLFAPEIDAGDNVFADAHSNTEYGLLQKPVSRQSNVVRRRGAWIHDSSLHPATSLKPSNILANLFTTLYSLQSLDDSLRVAALYDCIVDSRYLVSRDASVF